MTMPTKVHASHILVPDLKSAEECKKKIAEGDKFARVAKRFSKCPSSANGGDLGWFER